MTVRSLANVSFVRLVNARKVPARGGAPSNSSYTGVST